MKKDLDLTKESHQDIMVALLIHLWGDWDDVKDFAGQYLEWDGCEAEDEHDYYVNYFATMLGLGVPDGYDDYELVLEWCGRQLDLFARNYSGNNDTKLTEFTLKVFTE